MREECPSSQQRVRLPARQSFESFQHCVIDPLCPELLDEFIIIDCRLFAIGGDRALYVPRGDDLIVRVGSRCGGFDF